MSGVTDLRSRFRPDETKSLTGRIKRASASGEFEAVIATLNVIDSDGDIILPGAFGGATVSIVPAHDHGSVPLGKAKMEDRGDEAVAVGRFNLDTQPGKEWHSALKFDLQNGSAVQEWSFGFRVLDSEDDVRNGQRVRVLKRLDVMEISPVLRGAGRNTRTLAVKSRAGLDSVLTELESPTSDLQRLLRRATPQQLRRAQPMTEPVLGRARRTLGRFFAEDSAKAILDAYAQETDGSVRYVTFPAPRWVRDLAKNVAHWCDLPAPNVKMLRRASLSEPADFVSSPVSGSSKAKFNEIYVLDGLSKRETAVVVGHEVRHLWEKANGQDPDEDACDRYGLAVCKSVFGEGIWV